MCVSIKNTDLISEVHLNRCRLLKSIEIGEKRLCKLFNKKPVKNDK